MQLDRFLIKIPMAYVDTATEIAILEAHAEIRHNLMNVEPVCSRGEVLAAREIAEQVFVSPALRRAIVEIVQATRNNPLLQHGASTRAALMLQAALKGWALVNGRSYCTEDDLKFMAPFVLLHRLRFHGGAGTPHEALHNLMAPHIENLARRLR